MYQSSLARRSLVPAIPAGAMLGRVLGIVGGGVVVTAAAAYLTQSFALPPVVSIVTMLVGFGFLFAINGTRANEPLSMLMFYLFTAAEGVGIAPAIARYGGTDVNGASVVVEASVTTALGLAVCAIVAFMTSFDYRKLTGVAFALLLALVGVGLVTAFTHFIHPQTYAWLTLAVFALLTVIDFARVRAQDGSATAVQMATSIYLDALNIFLALLRIFGGGRDR